jgi:hypothetical protein
MATLRKIDAPIQYDPTYGSVVKIDSPITYDPVETMRVMTAPLSGPAPVPDFIDTGIIIGAEVVPALVGAIGGGAAGGPMGALGGGAAGSAFGNYLSQNYRLNRGFQDEFGVGEFGAATAFGAVPVGRLASVGGIARTGIRATQGAGLATGELYARTYLDEDRPPTKEEIASTVLFGGAFGGALGALEAKWLGKNLVDGAEEGMTRPEVLNKHRQNIEESGGLQNHAVGNPLLSNMDVESLAKKSPKEAAEESLQAVENKLLNESDEMVQQIATGDPSLTTPSLTAPSMSRGALESFGTPIERQNILGEPSLNQPVMQDSTEVMSNIQRVADDQAAQGDELVSGIMRQTEEGQRQARDLGAVEQMANFQKTLDDELAQQDEIFTPLMREVNIGMQKVGDNARLRVVQEQIAKLDHKHGKNKGASNQRKKLNAERNRILKRNNLTLDDLEAQMQASQMPPTRQDTPLRDRPMEQADPMTKSERMAEEKLGRGYEKYFNVAMPIGAGGAAAYGLLANEEDAGEFKQAGIAPILGALLIAAGIRGPVARKLMRRKEFKQANAQAKVNPTKAEPDVVRAERAQQTADKAVYVDRNQLKQMTDGAMEFVSDLLTPLSRKLKNISPKLAQVFRAHERNINTTTRQYLDRVSPFLKMMQKRLRGKKDLQREFKTLLLNGSSLGRFMDKVGVSGEGRDMLKDMRQALDELRTYAREEGGIDVGYLDKYFPRQVKDYKNFKKFLDDNDDMRDTRNQVEIALEDYRVEKKLQSVDDISTEEAAEITSRVLRGYPLEKGGILPGNVKQRKIEQIEDRFLDAYADPADAMQNYVDRLVQATERKKFLFRKPKDKTRAIEVDDGVTDRMGSDLGIRMEVDESLAGTVARTLANDVDGLSPEDVSKLQSIIQSRFSGKTVAPFVQGVKNLNYIQVMGNFGSAITQLGDLAYSIHFNGFGNTFRSLVNRADNYDFVKHFNLADHNIDTLTNGGGLSKVLDRVFTVTGLKKLDQLGKNTTMNAAWKKYKSQAQKDAPKLADDLEPVFGKERAEGMVRELQNSNPNSKDLPKGVEELIWYKFLDLSPATLGEMPRFYNESGNARILYMLKSFTVKQFDVFREAGFEDIRKAGEAFEKGNTQQAAKLAGRGMRNVVALGTVFAAANASTDVMKDLLYGRPIKRDELFEDNIWRLVGINRYLVQKGRREGPAKAFLEGLLPPTTVFDRAWQDISAIAGDKEYKGAMLQGTPLDLIYWRYLGGLDKIENMK